MTTQKNYFRRFWPIVVLLVLIIATAFSYAYWDDLTKSDPRDITIGEGVTLDYVVTVDQTGNLVPDTAIIKDGDVTEVSYTYTVKLDKAVTTPLQLLVAESDKKIDGNSALGELFNVEISLSAETINFGADVEVTVTVTLNEPTEEQYDLIAGKILSFTLQFQAKQN